MPRPEVLTPEVLRTFVTFARAGLDTGRTTGLLQINQSNLWQRLQYFTGKKGPVHRPWLVATKKTWSLTDEGQRMLPVVEDLLQRHDQMVRFVEGGAPAGLAVGCGREAAATLVLEALKEFHRTHRDAPYRVSCLRGRARIEGVSSGLLDLALVTHDEAQIAETARRVMSTERLLEDPLVLVAAPDAVWLAELPAEGRVTARALTRVPLVLPEPDSGLRRALDTQLQVAGVLRHLRVVVEAGGWDVILACAREGLGAAVVPTSSFARHRVRAERSRAEGPPLRHWPLAAAVAPADLNVLRLVCRPGPGPDTRDLSPLGDAFLEELRKQVKKEQDLIDRYR